MATMVLTIAPLHTIFSRELRSTELEEAINIVWVQPEKYDKDFDFIVTYLGLMVTMKGYNIQSVHVKKAKSQPAKRKVASFMKKIECKKYSKTVLNSMSRELQMQIRSCKNKHRS